MIIDYSPIVVIFPEDEAAGPPWRNGLADYYPRSVSIFLDDARLIRPRLIRSQKVWINWIAVRVESWLRPLRRALSERGGRKLKRMLAESLRQGKDVGLPHHVLDTGVSGSKDAWRRYHSLVNGSKDYAPTCYAQVLRRDGQLVIQYWFFYYYNDYWNSHQSDFEMVSVYFRKEGSDYRPTGCVWGAHRIGRFRLWDDVERRRVKTDAGQDRTHPLAYVARGSHAFYPRPKLPMWVPTLEFEVPLPLITVNMEIVPVDKQGEVLDIVPLPLDSEFAKRIKQDLTVQYDVRILPTNVEATVVPSDAKTWKQFWWLRFEGGWGPANFTPYFFLTQPSIQGPAFQDRFDKPWWWLEHKCQPDEIGRWRDL